MATFRPPFAPPGQPGEPTGPPTAAVPAGPPTAAAPAVPAGPPTAAAPAGPPTADVAAGPPTRPLPAPPTTAARPTVPPTEAGAPPAAALVAPTTAPPSGRPPLAALLLVVAVGLAFADASVVALALPDLYGELDTTIVGVSWVLTTYALVVAITAIPVALLHRRIRPAVLAGVGLGLFAVASLAAGLASSLPFLLTARAVQGVGATLLLAGSLPVLGAGLGSLSRARTWWSAAAGAGAVAGPALGGVLTQLLAWRAIFLVQAPVAAIALLACLTPAARALVADRHPADRRRRAGLVAALPANLAFVLVFAGLVAALFLGVLLAIEVWSYPPITAAVLVSALPVGMFAARWAGPARGVVGAVGGPLLLAAGLAGLAFLPGASPWAAAIAFALCGAGFGVVSALLDPATTPDHNELVRDSTVSVGARHAGLVLGLVLIAPALTASLDNGIDRATLGATRSMLEAEVPVTDKVSVAWDLRDIISTTPKGQVPDLGQVFDDHGAKGNNKMAVARDSLMATITDTITRAFRPAFAIAALLAALAAVPAFFVARQRRRREPRAGPRHRLVGVVAVGALVAGGLFVAEQAAGASDVGTYVAVDPCTAGPDPYPGSGLDAVAQRIALSALNGAACDLHTTRERLVLSLDPSSGYTDVTWDDATREQALRSGTQRAINDAEDRGTLPGWAAAVLRFTADHAPVTWIVEHLPF